MSDSETSKLATKFIDHATNDGGEILANVYEAEAFKALYDPRGVDERKLRLPRKQMQVYNQLDSDAMLFQKVYYHPGLLMQDEQQLRALFFSANQGHDSLQRYVGVAMFAGFWPALYSVSRSVKPFGCVVFAASYGMAWSKVVRPFLNGRLQTSLNSSAAAMAEKYNIKTDAHYLA